MLSIYCPYCNEMRDEEEFSYSGEAHIKRPEKPFELTDEQWGQYLFFRKNPSTLHAEMWNHSSGCRQYFNVVRDMQSYKITETYPIAKSPKSIDISE